MMIRCSLLLFVCSTQVACLPDLPVGLNGGQNPLHDHVFPQVDDTTIAYLESERQLISRSDENHVVGEIHSTGAIAVHSASAGQKQKPTSAHDQEIDEAQRLDQEATLENIDGAPKAIRIRFGSSRHADGPRVYTTKGTGYRRPLFRPEPLKMTNWNGQAWVECTRKKDCWHGYDNGQSKPDLLGRLLLDVPAKGPYTKYAFDAWARCEKGALWFIKERSLINGKLAVYINGVHKTIVAKKKGKLVLPIDANKDSHIHVEFVPLVHDKVASGLVQFSVYNVSPYSDQCMTTKFCLKVFGDGSDAGYEFRNVNQEQLHCLVGDRESMSPAVSSMCSKWLSCLHDVDKQLLESYLRAALTKKASLPAIASVAMTSRTTNHECIDPETADPESWECECADAIQNACSTSHSDTQCFAEHMCNHCGICLEWKKQHCSNHAVDKHKKSCLAVAFVESAVEKRQRAYAARFVRRQVSTKSNALNAIDNELDGTVQGKCSQ